MTRDPDYEAAQRERLAKLGAERAAKPTPEESWAEIIRRLTIENEAYRLDHERLEKERDEARAMIDAMRAAGDRMNKRIGEIEAERDALAAKLEAVCEERTVAIARAEAAEAKLATAMGCLDTEQETLRRVDAAESRAAALAEILRHLRQDIQHHNCMSETCDACEIDAALAGNGNGTGEGAKP